MEGIANFISMLDYVLDTKRKRHITGGLLLSGALLFGGLAMTVMSIRDDEEDEDEYSIYRLCLCGRSYYRRIRRLVLSEG